MSNAIAPGPVACQRRDVPEAQPSRHGSTALIAGIAAYFHRLDVMHAERDVDQRRGRFGSEAAARRRAANPVADLQTARLGTLMQAGPAENPVSSRSKTP